MNSTQSTVVKTKDGRTFFASCDALVKLALTEAGNPEVVAVQMPSGAWSTKLADRKSVV